MITIICGTNRPNSNSQIIADHYANLLKEREVEHELVSLIDLPKDFIFADTFGNRTEKMQALIDQVIVPSGKFVFVIPEYNGGFPGVLKAFIDSVPPSCFHGKKAGLVGLSSGHAGNLRGMDQFTNVLNYLQVNVLFNKPKLSHIENCIDENRAINDGRVEETLSAHCESLLSF